MSNYPQAPGDQYPPQPGTPYQPPAAPYQPPAAPYQPPAAPYQQPGMPYPAQPVAYAPVAMGPQRNTMIFVVSILLLIGAGLDLIGVFGLVALLSWVGTYGGSGSGMVVLSLLFAIVAAVFLLITGILGIKNAADVTKADLLFKLGIGLCAVSLLSMIFGIIAGGAAYSGVIGFVLPVLFVIGAMNMKKQAQQPAYPYPYQA